MEKKSVIGKKQSAKNSDWLSVVNHIEDYVSENDINLLEAKTIDEIRRTIYGKKAAYAWSGGKDSIVLGHLCEKAGIKDCILGICNLEYPAFLNWVKYNKPQNLEIINTGQDLEWLSKHEDMIFPQNSKTAGRWFSMVQHKAQSEYVLSHGVDILLLGRRKADGNFVGKNNLYTDKRSVTRYSPLANWKHEDVLGYIYYKKLNLPPFYSWKNGYLCGTHPWSARQWTGSVKNGWKDIFNIDKSIVIKAAEKIKSAADFLKEVHYGN